MIIVKVTGGLGNQMFQYAFARAIKNKIKTKVFLDSSRVNYYNKDSDYEIAQKYNALREFGLGYYKITLEEASDKIVRKIYNVPSSELSRYFRIFGFSHMVYMEESDIGEKWCKYSGFHDYFIKGYYFDLKYYSEIRTDLQRELLPKEESDYYKSLNPIFSERETVSVHIRRGDFLEIGRDISSSDYYYKAIEYIRNNVNNPYFLVFSDDINWVKENFKIDEEHLYVSELDLQDVEEWSIMRRCRHHINANSTFSYWAAWLGSDDTSVVISPKGWRRKIIPDNWILM